jgi:hypothetical protein
MNRKAMEKKEDNVMKKKNTKKINPKPGTTEYIDSLCGIIGHKGNLSGTLLKDRREDDARQMKKFERYFKTDTNPGDDHNKPE